MSRLTRIESRQLTRRKLLEAARLTFTRAGYAGSSVDLIAEEAGFSKGALYSNFEGKEAIFLELLEAHMSGEIAVSAGFLSPDGSLDEVIAQIATRYAADPVDLDWCLLSIEFALHARRSPQFAARRAELFARHYQAVADIISAVGQHAGVTIDDPVVAATVFVALRQGLALERSQLPSALTEVDVRRALASWMRNLLDSGDIACPTHGSD